MNTDALHYLLDRRLGSLEKNKNSIPKEVPQLGLVLWLLCLPLFGLARLFAPEAFHGGEFFLWLFYGLMGALMWGVVLVTRSSGLATELKRRRILEELRPTGLSETDIVDGVATFVARRVAPGALLLGLGLTLVSLANGGGWWSLAIAPGLAVACIWLTYLTQCHGCWTRGGSSSNLLLPALALFGPCVLVGNIDSQLSPWFILAYLLLAPRWLAAVGLKHADALDQKLVVRRKFDSFKSVWKLNPVTARHLVGLAGVRPLSLLFSSFGLLLAVLFSQGMAHIAFTNTAEVNSENFLVFVSMLGLVLGLAAAGRSGKAVAAEGPEGLEALRLSILERSTLVDGWALVGMLRNLVLLLLFTAPLLALGLMSELAVGVVAAWVLAMLGASAVGAYAGTLAVLTGTENFEQKLVGAGFGFCMFAMPCVVIVSMFSATVGLLLLAGTAVAIRVFRTAAIKHLSV
ncbi:MAG: hypothetical protein KC910_18270 [Candidatus Eremiobacteraeota bacterium]|nr:hypothetical protein [Candidatus Eremiobacteraeota bacterium]